MTDFSWVPALLWGVVIIAGLWPGAEPTRAPDKPKKGYWTVGTVFWPMRRAYHDLWPHHAILEQAVRNTWLLAFGIAGIFNGVVNGFHLGKVISPWWIMTDVAVVAFLLGRVFGYWSADRKIIKAQQADEAAAKAPA